MIGVAYFKKSSFDEEFLAYIPSKGWIKSKGESFFKKNENIIFISNLESLKNHTNLKNIKKDSFFYYTFEKLIYYFNASTLPLKEKLKLISKCFNDALYFYKENFGKELQYKDLINLDNFYEVYNQIINKKIKTPKNFPEDITKQKTEMIITSEQEFENHYLRRKEFDLLETIFDINIPISEFESISINEIGEIKNITQAIDTFSSEYFLIIKGTLENFGLHNKKILPKRIYGESVCLFKDEVIFLSDYTNIKIEEFLLSSSYFKFGEVFSYKPNIKKTRIANRIIISNYIEKIFSEISDNRFINAYIKEKLLSENFKNVCLLKKNNFNIIAYTDIEIITSVKKEDVNKLLKEVEKIDFIYSTDMII